MVDNNSKFCLGEIVTSWTEFDQLFEEAKSDYDLIEVWVDFIKDYSPEKLERRLSANPEKLIVLTRRNDQEDFQLSLEDRKIVIDLAIKNQVLCDLDINQQQAELQYYNSQENTGSNLIVSFHNYQETPSFEDFNQLFEDMLKFPAKIYKIATFSQSLADSLKLLSLYESAKDKLNLLVMAGGADGFITRVAAYYYGQEIIYAPRSLDKQVIAGQISLDQFVKLNEIINGRK